MEPSYHYLVPSGVPTFLLYGLAAIGLYGWIRLYQLGFADRKRPSWSGSAGRILAGFAALTLLAQALQRHLFFAITWPLWPILLAGAAAVEAVVVLYQPERESLVPARTGIILTAVRVSLVLLLVFMLCQPVRIFERIKKTDRKVAVLVDTSLSMAVPDNNATPAEKIRLAYTLAIPTAGRPGKLDQATRRLKEVQQKLVAQADGVAAFASQPAETRRKELRRQCRTLRDTLAMGLEAVSDQSNSLVEATAGPALKADKASQSLVTELCAALATHVQARFTDADKQLKAALQEKQTSNAVAFIDKVLNDLRGASAALADMEPKLTAAGETLDTALYHSLSAGDRRLVDQAVSKKRAELACDILFGNTHGPDGKRDILFDRLQKMYGVRLYMFASQPSETDVQELKKNVIKASASSLTNSPGQCTDIAAALEKAAADTPSEQMTSILLLTDGCHNASKPFEPIAQRLGLQSVPVSSVAFGNGRRPPTDAAIVSVEAPETVSAKDKVYINTRLKLDGLAGTNVTVSLYRDQHKIGSQSVTVATDRVRTTVPLTDEPPTNGLNMYRVVVQPMTGEVVQANNTYEVPVLVTDDQIKLLLVDGWPRWEFRYLKNLFSSRDLAVKLQYVLFHPDQIAQSPARPPVNASATRPPDQPEATALPANEDEWMKFDVVILGDLEPASLGPAELAVIRKFVSQRGGTLVVVSGPLYMPHAYTATTLAELLPVAVEPSEQDGAAAPEDGYRFMLTAEGNESPMMRLAEDPARNRTLWSDMPDLYWRHDVKGPKPGAIVLAYALSLTPPPYMRPKCAGEVPDADILHQRQQFERDHPLLVTHHVGAGRVLFLGCDQTWRFRYRVGDTLHHKFWGQVLRWATADKLFFGTGTVRIGTDQLRYAPGTRVRVRAKLTKSDYTPVANARLSVQCTRRAERGEPSPVLRKVLHAIPDSPGMYAPELGVLPAGKYRVELDPREAKGLDEGFMKNPLFADFVVLPVSSSELVELSADRGLLARLASLTGGRAVDPPLVHEAIEAFGPPRVTIRERRQYNLWNSWPLLTVLITLAGIEWVMRRRAKLP